MRSLVLVLAVVLTALLTTATTLVASPAPVVHAGARALHDEIRARAHGVHAGHAGAVDQDDDVDDDGSEDDVGAPDDDFASPLRPLEAEVAREPVPVAEGREVGLGPSAGHASLPDHPPRALAS